MIDPTRQSEKKIPSTGDNATTSSERGAKVRQHASEARSASPRSVITGGNKNEGTMSGTSGVFLDWLAFSWSEDIEGFNSASILSQYLGKWFSDSSVPLDVKWIPNPKGLFGFESSVSFYVCTDNVTASLVGQMAYGGTSQKGRMFLALNGTGCGLIKDWEQVKCIIDTMDAKITRVDLALDDFNGEIINVDNALLWYCHGQFQSPGKGGNAPSMRMMGDWVELSEHDACNSSRGAGRTLYVGRRQNGKLARIYEKGKQLGNSDSRWTRFEIEILSKSREIPSDVLTDPAAFFAGSYRCTGWFLFADPQRIKTIQKTAQISLDSLIGHARTAYGKLVNVFRNTLNWADVDIVNALIAEGSPRRLAPVIHHDDYLIGFGLEPEGVNS